MLKAFVVMAAGFMAGAFIKPRLTGMGDDEDGGWF
mgnify:CR=1 FL=1